MHGGESYCTGVAECVDSNMNDINCARMYELTDYKGYR